MPLKNDAKNPLSREEEIAAARRHSHLLHMDAPERFPEEIRNTLDLVYRDFEWEAFLAVFRDVVDLFEGRFPGYRACNTRYHNLEHTMDTLLAAARLIHGVHLEREPIEPRKACLGLIAALMHDTGYIQEEEDTRGTGAKYSQEHVSRSADFAAEYLRRKGFSHREIQEVRSMILCTDLTLSPEDLRFPCRQTEIMAKILGSADLLGQMSARNYLEKLSFLYEELHEAHVPYFEDEMDLFQQTEGFYSTIRERLDKPFENFASCMKRHFRERWGLDLDVYADCAEKNIRFLREILQTEGPNFRSRLKRNGIQRCLDLDET